MYVKLWTRQYTMAVVVMFGLYLSISLLMSLTAVYSRLLAGNDSYAGIVVSAFTIGAFIVRFISGAIVDRFGSKKVILVGLGIMTISYAALFFSNNITQLLISRVVQGVGFGIAATATGTLIANVCHPERLLEAIGYSSVAQSLTSVIGPALGYWIVGEAFEGFPVLFMTAVCIGGATFMVMLAEKEEQSHGIKRSNVSDEKLKIRWSRISIPIMIIFLSSMSSSAVLSFLALYAISVQLTGIGAYFSVNALGMIVSRFVMNRLVYKLGSFPVIMLNVILFAVCMFGLTQVHNEVTLILLAFPAGFAMGSINPIINAFLIQVLPKSKKGFANAIYFSSIDIGYGVGSVFWGMVAGWVGYVSMFIAVAILQLVVVVLSLLQLRLKEAAVEEKLLADAS